jgi:hypothetical protein
MRDAAARVDKARLKIQNVRRLWRQSENIDIISKEVNFLSEHRRDCKCTKAISLVVAPDPTFSVDPP